MALNTDKFLTMSSNGIRTLAVAINLSTGATNANQIISTNSAGKIDTSLLPSGQATEVMIASEALSAGDFVNIYDNSGTRNCRKADASNSSRYASGYTISAVTSGSSATIILQGTNTALTNLTINGRYYLSASTPGQATVTAPTTATNIVQLLGFAVSTTSLNFEFDDFILLS